MSLRDLIDMAFRNLWKRKLRTFLTVLGVIIGTASIVVMISVGIGMNEGYKKQIEEMGSLSVINVYNYGGGYASSDSMGGGQKKVELNKKTLEEIGKIKGVQAVSPVVSDYFALIDGKYVCGVSVQGVDPAIMPLLGYNISEGRTLEEGDNMTVVLGATTKEEFYNPKQSSMSWYGSGKVIEIDIENDKFKITYDTSYGTQGYDKSIKPEKVSVVGVMGENSNGSWSCYMPIKNVEKMKELRAKQNKEKYKSGVYEEAIVKVENVNDVVAVQDAIKEMGFQASSLTDWLNSMKETSRMLQMVLGAIGAVSLFVAAIGITNTMVMSIYERTREIGVMKVIGASLKDIKMLFLTEASFIGFIGGIIGVLLSFGVSKLINIVAISYGQAYDISHITWYLAIAAVGFATLIGTAAGFFPAVRATKLSALAAIKTE